MTHIIIHLGYVLRMEFLQPMSLVGSTSSRASVLVLRVAEAASQAFFMILSVTRVALENRVRRRRAGTIWL